MGSCVRQSLSSGNTSGVASPGYSGKRRRKGGREGGREDEVQ